MTESEILRIWNGPTSVCNKAKILKFAADYREAILTALRKRHAVYQEHWSESDANRSGAYGIREAIEIILALDAAPVAKPAEIDKLLAASKEKT